MARKLAQPPDSYEGESGIFREANRRASELPGKEALRLSRSLAASAANRTFRFRSHGAVENDLADADLGIRFAELRHGAHGLVERESFRAGDQKNVRRREHPLEAAEASPPLAHEARLWSPDAAAKVLGQHPVAFAGQF